MQERSFTTRDGLRLCVSDWPARDDLPVVLCLPGLTRNARDFDAIARTLNARGHRVLAPDFRGRGRSGYDPDPMRYVPATYVQDMLELLVAMDVNPVVVIGTSLGGIVGMAMAAARPGMLAGLVLNDVGPEIAPAGIARIMGYLGKTGHVENWQAASAAVERLNADIYPDMDARGWMRMARATFREQPDGSLRPDYDPALLKPFAAGKTGGDMDMWRLFDAAAAHPLLCLRGETSDILAEATFRAMLARAPAMRGVTVPRVGHVPLLDEPQSVAAILQLLDQVAGQRHDCKTGGRPGALRP